MMNSKVYDVLKWVALIALPAVTTCAGTILALVGVDAQTVAIVVGIGTAVDTCLGTLLGISNAQYKKTLED